MDPQDVSPEKLLAHAAHDLQEPLRGIQTLAEWIEEDAGGALPSESRSHLAKIRALGRRAHVLVDDLLSYSRLSSLERPAEELETTTLVRGIADRLAADTSARFDVEDLPPLQAPRHLVEIVVGSLLENALKHHDRDDPHVRVRAIEDAARRGLVFEDDGPGIPAAHHGRVFHPLETLRPRDEVEGSGMGLALARRAAQLLGGSLELESEGERGTSFVLWLPRS